MTLDSLHLFIFNLVRKFFLGLMVTIALVAGPSGQALAQNPPITLSQPMGWEECASEGQWCQFQGNVVRDVAFGAKGKYVYMWAVQDMQFCSNARFWGQDPIPNAPKKCYFSRSPSRLSYGVNCAIQGDNCTVSGTATIWFGSGGHFLKRNVTAPDGQATTLRCSVAEFGQPFDGADKYCVYTP